jgi:hypothetical protein
MTRRDAFVRDFVAAWDKVMNLDRFEPADPARRRVTGSWSGRSPTVVVRVHVEDCVVRRGALAEARSQRLDRRANRARS